MPCCVCNDGNPLPYGRGFDVSGKDMLEPGMDLTGRWRLRLLCVFDVEGMPPVATGAATRSAVEG